MNETELFFTDEKRLPNFLGIGNKISKVIIPDGESVTEAERGYVAHKIILVEIKELWKEDTLK